jgi:hypothetical protein
MLRSLIRAAAKSQRIARMQGNIQQWMEHPVPEPSRIVSISPKQFVCGTARAEKLIGTYELHIHRTIHTWILRC